MDISSIKVLDTAFLTVKHPVTKEDTDIKIELLSPDGDRYKIIVSELAKKNKKKAQREITDKEFDESLTELLASMTVSWENMKSQGKVVKFSKEEAISIYSATPWLQKQVQAFVDKETNFLLDVPSS